MVIITLYCTKDMCSIELRPSYLTHNKFSSTFAKCMALGFKYNKVRRTFNKSYHTKDYAEDRVASDIEAVKKLFIHYKYVVYKLTNEETNYKAA